MTTRAVSHHIPAPSPGPGYHLVAYSPDSPLRFLEFALVTLAPAGALRWESRDREAVLYLIGGICDVTVRGADGDVLTAVLDSRPTPFDGPPAAVYVRPGAQLHLASPRTGARLALFTAPPAGERRMRVVGPQDAAVRTVGRETFSRKVVSVIDLRTASRLLVGETVCPPGHWSSYPPHKHDAAVPGRELPMEEIYHYFVQPPGGFALQMVYTRPDAPAPFERIHRVRDGDTVVIPRGYHPVVAAGGYQLVYLWAISGEQVDGTMYQDDPAHAWLLL